ncbi:hypothetical protein CGRA01v4_05255 [Colletotrichum graminicola]|nr:hypothetical protein CGRA01v4_05255 [Colletotrichum graminicola]
MADHHAASSMAGEGRHQHQHHQHQQHQQPQQPDRESGSNSRPSFTEYWMAEKQGGSVGKLKFVNEGLVLARQLQYRSSSSSSSPPSAMESSPPKDAGDDERQQDSGEFEVFFVFFPLLIIPRQFHFRYHFIRPLGAYASSTHAGHHDCVHLFCFVLLVSLFPSLRRCGSPIGKCPSPSQSPLTYGVEIAVMSSKSFYCFIRICQSYTCLVKIKPR